MERTNEAIYNRAAEQHIRQPNPYEEEDEDSVKVKFANTFFVYILYIYSNGWVISTDVAKGLVLSIILSV